MKVSFVTIALNEEKTIDVFLESLANQSKKPDEIIFVDNGSEDKTVEKVKKSRLKIKIFVKGRATIAQLRNFGIKKTKNDIIAMADADCTLYKDWLKKITMPFENKSVDIVAGFYKKTGNSVLQRCLSPYFGVFPEKFDPEKFLPATCSIAFRKKIWAKIGGFNERLEKAGEDTLFNYRGKQLGAKFIAIRDALVDWEVPSTLQQATKKFYYYAKGDAQTGIWWHPQQRLSTHNVKILAVYGRYLFGVLVVLGGFYWKILFFWATTLLLGYLLWAVWKNFHYVKKWQAFFLLPIIQIISDFCVMIGFASGVFKKV